MYYQSLCTHVLFLIQRYRYVEAYQVNLKLWSLEQDFISTDSVDEEVLSRMESQRQWRKELVVSGLNFEGILVAIALLSFLSFFWGWGFLVFKVMELVLSDELI